MTDGQTRAVQAVSEIANGQTQASHAYRRLRRDIVTSELPAGSKLRIRDLCEKYDFAMSSIREALNRLMRDGLVQLIDLRGFSVSPMTIEDLEGLTKARFWMNERALRESIALGDAEWEEGVVLSFHRMSRTPKFLEAGSSVVNPEWETAHRAFHASLISACGSNWVTNYCEQLFEASDRYRYAYCEHGAPGDGTTAAPGERPSDDHRELMEATISRDADTAVVILKRHFDRTADYCRSVMSRAPAKSVPQRRPRARAA